MKQEYYNQYLEAVEQLQSKKKKYDHENARVFEDVNRAILDARLYKVPIVGGLLEKTVDKLFDNKREWDESLGNQYGLELVKAQGAGDLATEQEEVLRQYCNSGCEKKIYVQAKKALDGLERTMKEESSNNSRILKRIGWSGNKKSDEHQLLEDLGLISQNGRGFVSTSYGQQFLPSKVVTKTNRYK